MSNEKPIPRVKVVLLQPHTHEGVDYEIGAEIEVDESTRAWLINNDVVAEGKAATETK